METLKKIWEWLKLNWKWLLFPIGIALFILGKLSSRGGGSTIDPVVKADERAKVEEDLRKTELAEESKKLQDRLTEVHTTHVEKLKVLTEEQLQQAADLEDDPEALNSWLNTL